MDSDSVRFICRRVNGSMLTGVCDGKRTYEVDAPLNLSTGDAHIPIYYRCGSDLPLPEKVE